MLTFFFILRCVNVCRSSRKTARRTGHFNQNVRINTEPSSGFDFTAMVPL